MANKLEINTERLLLRSLTINDAKAIFKYRSDSVANQYQGWVPKTISDVHEFIENRVSPTIDLSGTWFQFGIIKKGNNELIGDLGIHFLDSDKYQVEIGFTLNKNQQGKGYATEAIKEIINYLFKLQISVEINKN